MAQDTPDLTPERTVAARFPANVTTSTSTARSTTVTTLLRSQFKVGKSEGRLQAGPRRKLTLT